MEVHSRFHLGTKKLENTKKLHNVSGLSWFINTECQECTYQLIS